MFNKNFSIKDIFNGIRLIILIVILCWSGQLIYRFIHKIANLFPDMDYQMESAFENYEPKIVEETTELPSIDTTPNLWERLWETKYKGKPAIIYLDIEDEFKIPDELIYSIKADGDWIKTRTYNTETNKRSSYNYPYYKYFQISAPRTIIYSRDYFDWERLSILMDYNPIDKFEIKAISELRFNPWSLSMGIYATSQGKCGITLKKRLW